MTQWSEYFRFVTAILVIVNPVGAVPIFLGVTVNQTPQRRNQTAAAAAMTTACVLLVSIIAGDRMLLIFGINVPCFQVGGGILILLMAIAMLQAKNSRVRQTPEERRDAEENESVGVVPLGTPLLAGPGTIVTAIIYANKAGTWFDTGFLLAASLLIAACVWLVLRLAHPIGVALGRTGINILTRLMGLILAAVAIKFITDGLLQLLPHLGAG